MLSATLYQSGLGATLPSATGAAALQDALRRFALKQKDPKLDPAKYDGTMTIGTIIALANAAPKLGNKIDPVVGQALDVVGLLKKPFSYVPYGDVIINFILSPWIIDSIYGALLGIIRIVPGGSGIADAIHHAIGAVKSAINTVAAPIAGAISIVVGANLGCGWTDPLDCVSSAASSAADAVSDAVKAAGSLVVDAANAVASAAKSVGSALASVASAVWDAAANSARVVWNAVEKYGCALVNNDIVVAAAAAGAGIVATPATSAAIVTGAQAGKAACAVMAVADLAYAIYKLLSNKFPPPPVLTPPANIPAAALVNSLSIGVQLFQKAPATPPAPPVLPKPTTRYPVGTIAAFDPKLNKYRLAIPLGTRLTLAATTHDSLGAAADVTHMEVPTSSTVPSGIPTIPLTIFQRSTGTLPFYKKPVFWVSIGVSAAAVGGGAAFMVYRRRRARHAFAFAT